MKFLLRKMVSILLLISVLLSLLINIYAAGDPNIDSGGGGMGSGTSQNVWNPGYDGVRITIVNAETGNTIASSIDYTNKTLPSTVYHFNSVSKIKYKQGSGLSLKTGSYSAINPAQKLPVIISDGEYMFSDINQIRSYFTDEQVIHRIAEHTGMNFTVLTNGSCKLLLEPIAYFKYNGIFYAMTATEAALLDNQVGGNLRSKMAPLTHKNAPLAMFLEKSDLGFSAWTGSTTATATNSDIINYLGIGLVSFKEDDTPDIVVSTPDYTYRVNTDVITSVTISGGEATPDNPVTAVYSILGTNYYVNNIVYPRGGSQLVWIKWHTPNTPQTVNIRVNVYGVGNPSKGNITAKIESLDENPPPDPTAYDKKKSNFSIVSAPNKATRSSASWSVWSAYWVPVWRWCSHRDWGHWVDEGYWQFYTTGYSASISATMNITPDSHSPTAYGKNMKSGYGFTERVTATVSTSAPTSMYTYGQNAVSYFPEFMYKTYWRLLERTSGGTVGVFEFKKNPYSTYNSRVHFTPCWFPDGNYKCYTYILDMWTPAGMLSAQKTDDITIYESVFSDWHYAPA